MDRKTRELADKKKKYIRFQSSAEGMETAKWTMVHSCLEGGPSASHFYDMLEENYFSYGPDGFRAVGPTFGPLHIEDLEKAKEAFARAL